jgi:NADPH-dependent curcumin reductase CurA
VHSHPRLPNSYVDTGIVPEDAFGVEQSTIDAGALPEGGVLVEVLYLSVDPCEWAAAAWRVPGSPQEILLA